MVDELNQGTFEALPLSGRLKQVTGPAAPLLLGGLTFGAAKPADLKVRPLGPANHPTLGLSRRKVSGRDLAAVDTHDMLSCTGVAVWRSHVAVCRNHC